MRFSAELTQEKVSLVVNRREGIGRRVRKKRRQNVKGPDCQLVAGIELVERIGALQHLGSIEREDGVKRARQGVDGERLQGIVRPRTLSENRVQVGTVVRVAMADEYRIEPEDVAKGEGCGHPVPRVDEEAEAILFDEVSAAGPATTGIAATAPDHREPHRWKNSQAYSTSRIPPR